MKIRIFLIASISLFLIGCGPKKGTGTTNPTSTPLADTNNSNISDRFFSFSAFPLKFKVNKDKYNEFKAQFDDAEASYKSKSGKSLIVFVPVDDNPKFNSYDEVFNYGNLTGEMWVFFKENVTEFVDLESTSAGSALTNSIKNEIYNGQIIFNFTLNQWSDGGYNFGQVLLHEIGHVIGFDHTSDSDFSIMNYNYIYKVNGLTNLDIDRTHDKYPFSVNTVSIKDLERIGANKKLLDIENMSHLLSERFSLSEDRSLEVAKIIQASNQLRNKRQLTKNEVNYMNQKILGFSYDEGQAALEKYIQGETLTLDKLIELAAIKNGISPEQVKELFSDYFL